MGWQSPGRQIGEGVHAELCWHVAHTWVLLCEHVCLHACKAQKVTGCGLPERWWLEAQRETCENLLRHQRQLDSISALFTMCAQQNKKTNVRLYYDSAVALWCLLCWMWLCYQQRKRIFVVLNLLPTLSTDCLHQSQWLHNLFLSKMPHISQAAAAAAGMEII